MNSQEPLKRQEPLIFLPIQHIAAFNTKEIGQETKITRSDSSVLGYEYQRGTV